MGVASDLDEHSAEHAVYQPGRTVELVANLAERDLQFVQRVVASLVHARMLARRSDEQA
jgi:hypothetical protein